MYGLCRRVYSSSVYKILCKTILFDKTPIAFIFITKEKLKENISVIFEDYDLKLSETFFIIAIEEINKLLGYPLNVSS